MTKKINSKRGRPASFDRDEALEKAQALFHRYGYESLGVAQISDALGIKPPSLYGAFGNKAQLYEAALERYTDTTGRFMAKAFAESTSVQDGIRRMLLAAAHTYSQDKACAGCMIMDGVHKAGHDEARSSCAVRHEATQKNIGRFIAKDYPDRSEVLASHIMITLAGLSAAARSGATPDALRDYALMVADGLSFTDEAA